MSFQADIDARKSGPVATFHKFRTGLRSSADLHLFVEGYDDICFYESVLSEINTETKGRWRIYAALGKKNMAVIVDLFYRSTLHGHNVLFLRDSDFDRFLGQIENTRHVFLTCGYAIENYVCTAESITSYIRSAFGVDSEEVNIRECVEQHEQRVTRLFTWMSPVIGACLFAIKNGRNIDLDAVNITPFYQTLYAQEELPEKLPPEILLSVGLIEDDFNETSNALGTQFTAQNSIQWLRGKFLLQCTGFFLKSFREEHRIKFKNRQISRFNRRSSEDFQLPSVFERLCGFARGTPDLRRALLDRLQDAAP